MYSLLDPNVLKKAARLGAKPKIRKSTDVILTADELDVVEELEQVFTIRLLLVPRRQDGY